MKISVCMAAYNGEKYIEKQLSSILKQLHAEDEIIVVDDCSTDNTVVFIESMKDARIHVIRNEQNMGVISTFERSIAHAAGEIIFLSDQDDEWLDDKVSAVMNVFEKTNADVVQHDAIIVDGNGNVMYESWAQLLNFGAGITKNFIKNTYCGCCMAFKRKVADVFIPIPKSVQSHDQWIGIIAELHHFHTVFMKEKLLKYVRHGTNTAPMKRRSIEQAILGRIKFIKAIIIHYRYSR